MLTAAEAFIVFVSLANKTPSALQQLAMELSLEACGKFNIP